MRRLYLQIYLALLGVVILFGVLASLLWVVAHDDPAEQRTLEGIASVVSELLPAADQPRAELQRELASLADRLAASFALYGADGQLQAAAGQALPVPDVGSRESGWMHVHGRRGPPAWGLRLPDGRWLVGRPERPHRQPGLALLAIALVAGAAGLGAYPIARRLTRRLERLQSQVDELGAGDLSARVDVAGKDEVAELALSFNRAAGRIEKLVTSQRDLLASASHELRSPLTRIRVAIELLAGDDRPELRDEVSRDIAELDELIGELLLASRLDSAPELARSEDVDLLAVVAEEAARAGAAVRGEAVSLRGDTRMLRRLARNLIENAARYASGSQIEVSLVPREEGVRLRVEDRGPGVPEAERERVFEPFYRSPGMAETGEGAGLGLALVRQIARHHGGDARCLPRDGGGTCFEVDLASG